MKKGSPNQRALFLFSLCSQVIFLTLLYNFSLKNFGICNENLWINLKQYNWAEFIHHRYTTLLINLQTIAYQILLYYICIEVQIWKRQLFKLVLTPI